ncbi:MAG: TetR/AcrR family transcriptional regulator [Candidatus Izemoplasmatales bacterium]|nr:TetR/AcrR family transcriptional regulator [Candidatus Izemoplasmatales bacterium]
MARITQKTKEETDTNIILAATELFSTLGYDKTKTKTIAQMCHIAEGTLFNYYPTKDDLLIAVFEHMTKQENMEIPKGLPLPMNLILAEMLFPIKQMTRIPKTFLLDLFISSIKLAKKKPRLFHKLAALDFKYIEKLKEKLDIYGDFDRFQITAQDVAEMMYAVVGGDFLIYLYTKEQSFEQFESKITPKIKALIEPYIGGHLT